MAASRQNRLTARVCPYLIAGQGEWRSAVAIRAQACGATAPPAELALDKQRRLCLVSEHEGCPTYQMARARERVPAPARTGAVPAAVTRWAIVRTTPLVLDRAGAPGVVDALHRRSTPQLALGGMMALVLAVVVLGRLPTTDASLVGDAGPSPSAVASPVGPRVTPSPAPTSIPAPSPSASATPAATASPSPAPTAAPSPTVLTYRVRSGDTLYDLAIRFETTIRAIQRVNGMTDTDLRVGQVLIIPQD